MNKNNLIYPNWSLPKSVNACSTTRAGGKSVPPYDSLNLGNHVNDDDNIVLKNRASLRNLCQLPSDPCWLEQVHGARVVNNLFDPTNNEADAIISRIKHQVLVIMTADCLPILLADKNGKEVAAIHAGWRSLSAGIIENTLQGMQTTRDDVCAWLGPCIGPHHFQVGKEVLQAFESIDENAHNAFEKDGEKYLANLQLLASNQLTKFGVKQIFQDKSCTFSNEMRFFSYRRDQSTGRMASLIWLS